MGALWTSNDRSDNEIKMRLFLITSLPLVWAGMGWKLIIHNNMTHDLEISAGPRRCWKLMDLETKRLIVPDWEKTLHLYTEQDNSFMACDDGIFEKRAYLTLIFKSLSYADETVPVHECHLRLWHRTSNFFNYCNLTNERCFGDFSTTLDSCGDTIGGQQAKSTFLFHRLDSEPKR